MQTYELGILTTTVTSGSVAAEFRAAASRPCSILEMGIFLNAATATTLTLGRPGGTPAAGTLVPATLPASGVVNGSASTGGIVLVPTGITVPTAGNSFRMITLPGAIGNGIVWTWAPGEMVVTSTVASALVIWNAAASSALRLYVKWSE